MNDIRRLVLLVIFILSLVLLWNRWQIHNGNKPLFMPSPSNVEQFGPDAAKTSNLDVPQARSNLADTSITEAEQALASTDSNSVQAQEVEVTTDVLRLTFSTKGGNLVRSELLQYTDDKHQGNVVLLQQNQEHTYVAQTGLTGRDLPNHNSIMQLAEGPRELADGQDTVQLRFESAEKNGIKLVKTWTLKRNSYEIKVNNEVINQSEQPIRPKLYTQLVRDNRQVESGVMFASTFTGPAVYTDEEKFQKVQFKDIDKNKFSYQEKSNTGYTAMVQHYFASAWILPAGLERENFVRPLNNGLYAVGSIASFPEIAPGGKLALDASLYNGPQIEREIQGIVPGLELVKDYGMVKVLAKPLYWLLDKIHGIIGNWGWSIVVLVFLLKIAFYWLNAKAYGSMAKMKALSPRITQMRARYKDDPKQMQVEMMKIYREEKVNPLGGCLPILVQMPFFIALYWVLLSSVEMRQAPWIGWITDLSVADPYFILPFLMMISSLFQVALNPAPPDPMQAKLMWIMPLAFSVMFFFFPAGLVLYWLTNNILTIAQQWIINTRMGVPPQFNLPKFK